MGTSAYGNLFNLRQHQMGPGGFGGFGQQPMLPQQGPTASPIYGHPGMGALGGGFGAPALPGGAFPAPVGPQPVMPHPGMNPGGPMLPGGGGYPAPVGPQQGMPPYGSGGFGGFGGGFGGVRPVGPEPGFGMNFGGGMNAPSNLNNLLMLQRMGMR